MISLLRSLGRKSLALPAVLIVCLLPAVASAQAAPTINIKNTTTAPVVVQIVFVTNGKVGSTARVPVAAGASMPAVALPGVKQVLIFNQQNQGLFKSAPIQPAMQDEYYDITLTNNPKMPVTLEKGTAPKSP